METGRDRWRHEEQVEMGGDRWRKVESVRVCVSLKENVVSAVKSSEHIGALRRLLPRVYFYQLVNKTFYFIFIKEI